jgi:hypothetical protein
MLPARHRLLLRWHGSGPALGMTVMPVRAGNWVTASFAGTTNLLAPEFPDTLEKRESARL